MKKYTFYATIEYALSDYDQIPYEYELCDETYDLVMAAVEAKKDFADAEELSDLYHEIFEELYNKEKERYEEMCNQEVLENGTPDDEITPFENFAFYVSF